MPPVLNATTWRTHPYRFKGYLWIDNPPPVFEAQVADAIITYPVADITYTNIILGAAADCWMHQTVWFGTAPGLDDLGRGRLRMAASGGQIHIGRSSQGTQDGTCNIVQGSWITVVDEFRVWARIPFIADGSTYVNGVLPQETTQFKDFDLPYTLGINGPPTINLGGGPGYVNYVDPLTNVITLHFQPRFLSKTFDTATFAAWHWDVGDGTITSTGPNGEITVTFPPGRRTIHLTGTDTNGLYTIRHMLVVACKDGTAWEPIKYFDMQDQKLDLDGNRGGVGIRVWSNIPRSTYPDNMMVMYWEDETYGDTAGPVNVISDVLGQTGFEHIKFCGWHNTDSNATTGERTGRISEVVLNCLDVAGWLDKRPSFPMEVNRMATPLSWYEMKSANMDKYFWYILYFHSTAPFITDFYDSNTGDMYAFSRLGSGQQSLYQQIQELSDRAIGYELTTNEQSMLFARANQSLLATANRTSTNIVSLTESDIADIRFTFTRPPRTHWNRGAAVLATTDDITAITTVPTAFAVAPGKGPGQGPTAVDFNEQLCTTPNELYTRTANRDAEANSNYADVEIELMHTGDAGIEPAYGQWVPITLSAAYAAQRGITFTAARLRVISTSISRSVTPEGTSKTVKFIGRVETTGVIAVDDTPPFSAIAAEPPGAPPTIVTSPAAIGWGNRTSFVPPDVLWMAYNGKVYRTAAFVSAPVTTEITPTVGVGVLGSGAWLLQDPWALNRWVGFWTGAIMTINDPWGQPAYPATTWIARYTPSAPWSILQFYGKNADASINRASYFGWCEFNGTNANTRYAWTTDYFSTVNYFEFGRFAWDTNTSGICIGCYNTLSDGLIVQYGFSPPGNGDHNYAIIAALTRDWGASWTWLPATSAGYDPNTTAGGVNIPYSLRGGGQNRSSLNIWAGGRSTIKVFNPDGALTSDTGVGSLYPFTGASMNSFTLDGNHLNHVRNHIMYRSMTGGVTWEACPVNVAEGALNGWPTNPNFLVGSVQSGYINWTIDRGNTRNWVSVPDNPFLVAADLSRVYANGGVHP